MATLAEIYDWFMTGKKPTQAQFWASWASVRLKGESIPQNDITNLSQTLNAKAEKDQFDSHKTDPEAHAESIGQKVDRGGYDGTAQELDDRVAAIENPDRVLKFGNISLDGLDMSIEANAFAWVLNKLSFLTPGAYAKTITAATDGMFRNDILVGTDSGSYEIIKGDEAATGEAITEKAAPEGTIKVGFVLLFGNTVLGSGTAPSIEKPTIVDEDRVMIDDSENSFSKKSVKFFNIKSILKSFFDAIYLNRNGEINLSAYPNTRNDGQLSTNKILTTDTSGNLKMCSMAIAPAPYLDELIPDSYLPSTTGNFILKGSFFTPTMTIDIEGQTINYIDFKSDNEVHVNVTTGNSEGSFDVTLNNGLSAVFSNALLVVLGEVYVPIESDWEMISGNLDLSESGAVKLITKDVFGTAKIINSDFVIPDGLDFEFRFRIRLSPLESDPNATYNNNIGFALISDAGNRIFGYNVWDFPIPAGVEFPEPAIQMITYVNDSIDGAYFAPYSIDSVFSIRRVSGITSYYKDGVLKNTSPTAYTSNLNIKALGKEIDFYDIKFVKLAT